MARHIIIVISFVLTLFASGTSQAELIDRIVAIVNDDIITFSDLTREGAPLFRRISQEAPPDQVEPALIQAREEMLANLIDKLIVEQRAEEVGISVSPEEVDTALERILDRNSTTLEEFRRNLELMGSDEEQYRKILRSQVIQSKLISYEIRSKVVITEEKIREFYEKNYLDKKESDAYHILQMGFTWKEDTPAARLDARQTAEGIRAKVLAGEDFRELARRFSQLPSAVDGGDIGVFKKDELASYMKSSILGLKSGEISQIVETPSGFQFFKILSSEGNVMAQVSFAEVENPIREKLYQESLDIQFEKWVKELKEQAYIKKML
jgi:peptidyl-prolyl cis-trans isomerase SurA